MNWCLVRISFQVIKKGVHYHIIHIVCIKQVQLTKIMIKISLIYFLKEYYCLE